MKKILILAAALIGVALAAPRLHAQTASGELPPDISLPGEGMVWVFDNTGEKPALLPVEQHGVVINKHTGQNLGWGITKGKATLDVAGLHAALVLTSGNVFFLAKTYARDNRGDDTSSFTPDAFYQLIRLEPRNKARAAHALEYGRGITKVTRFDQVVEAKFSRLVGSPWLKIVPTLPLPPGEYAVETKMPDPYTYSTALWDFAIKEPGSSAGK